MKDSLQNLLITENYWLLRISTHKRLEAHARWYLLEPGMRVDADGWCELANQGAYNNRQAI